MNKGLKYQRIQVQEDYPYALLLLAEETVDALHKYLFQSDVYAVKKNDETVAAFCLYEVDKNTMELKNMAVAERLQGGGIGSDIIAYIKNLCKDKYAKLIVGTADCATRQLRFYQKNGFYACGIRKDFFILNYDQPVYENGNRLKDMVLLQYEFTSATQ